MADPLPPLSAIGNCIIQVFGPAKTWYKWDTAKWDQATWAGPEWWDATPQSMDAQITWGTDDVAGILSVPAAGSWQIFTYDPARLLDPSNSASPLKGFLKPGGGVRILYRTEAGVDEPVRTGFIDEVEFDLASLQGSIRASDGISLMVKAKLPAGLADHPDTPMSLRARARWALALAGIDYIDVEVDPGGMRWDAAVGPALDEEASVWQHISAAALDAACAVWLDRHGVLRFEQFNTSSYMWIDVGGDVANTLRAETVGVIRSLENVYNHVRAKEDILWYDSVYDMRRATSIEVFGDLLIDRDRPNPNAYEWAWQVAQDRGSDTTRYILGTLRIQTEWQLLHLLDAGMLDRVFLRGIDATVHRDLKILGGRFEANTQSGWSAGLVTYQPAYPLEQGYIVPIRVARYFVNKNRKAYNSVDAPNTGSTPYNLEVQSRPATPATWQYWAEVYLDFPPIDWTGMDNLRDARLRIYRPFHNDTADKREIDFVKVRRITSAWTEATNYPGPGTDFAIELTPYVSTEDGWHEFPIKDLVWQWAPASIGGGGHPQYGIVIEPYWGDTGVDPPQHLLFNSRIAAKPPYLQLTWDHPALEIVSHLHDGVADDSSNPA